MQTLSSSYTPPVELELVSPTGCKLMLLAAHLPLFLAGLGAGSPWMGWVMLMLVISLAIHIATIPVTGRRLLLYPSGAACLIDRQGGTAPVRMLAGRVLGARLAVLTLSSNRGRWRVMVPRRGQAEMYRRLCRHLYGLPELSTTTGPNGRRSAAQSVV